MPPKGKPKAKKIEPPPTDTRKRGASNADEQPVPVKRPRRGTNQKVAEPDDAEKEEGDTNDDEGDSAPWAEVEEKAISKGKVKGPVRGGKKPKYIYIYLSSFNLFNFGL
jgi:hypothetical protein